MSGVDDIKPGVVEVGDIPDSTITLAKLAALTRGSIIAGKTASNTPTAMSAKTLGSVLIGDGTDVVLGTLHIDLADGTASATDVVLAAMAAGDKIVSVIALATKASIATAADRTSEYAAGAGKLVKAAGTNETNNQLLIFWWDCT